MKKSIALAGLLFLATTLFAQQDEENLPRVELYGGYSSAMADPFMISNRTTLRGWNASFGLNAAKWLTLVFEAGGNRGSVRLPVAVPTPFPPCPPFCPSSTDTFDVDTRLGTYLFGVRVPYRRFDRITPYLSVLIGKATVDGEVDGFKESSSGFSMALGGGGDIGLTKKFALRFQADYLRTDFYEQTQDNYRFQAGIVWRFAYPKKKRRYPEVEPEPTPPASTAPAETAPPAETTPAPPEATPPTTEPSAPPQATPPPQEPTPPAEPPK